MFPAEAEWPAVSCSCGDGVEVAHGRRRSVDGGGEPGRGGVPDEVAAGDVEHNVVVRSEVEGEVDGAEQEADRHRGELAERQQPAGGLGQRKNGQPRFGGDAPELFGRL
jgi:hypothetical protein